jgi:hypothetical protein
LARTKKLRKAKMQLSLEIRQRPVVIADSGWDPPDPAKSSLILTIFG